MTFHAFVAFATNYLRVKFIFKSSKSNPSFQLKSHNYDARALFVVMIYRSDKNPEETNVENKIKLLQEKGFSAKDISVILSELYGFNKNKIYKLSIG